MAGIDGKLDWFSRNLIEMLPAAVYACDAQAVVVAFNRRATELWGRTPQPGDTDERFCGSHKLFRTDGTFMPHHETPMEWVLRTGEHARDKEVVIERPDGSRVTVLVNISPILDQDGAQIGAVNCFQDLTIQKQSEDERSRLREELRQSQKLEAMGQLIGGIAHDFNNLLSPIMASLDMARRRELGGERERQSFAAALQSAERARTLVQRLLTFARQQPLQANAVDIGGLINGMAELISSTTGPRIGVVLDVEAGLPPARADLNQLEMAVLNLAVNARDAMPAGGVLNISVAREEAAPQYLANLGPGPFIRLSVSDTGSGMDEATLARAIEPFFSTKEVGKGTGLGLSMVHGLATQLGGGLDMTSRPGIGTTIDLWLQVSAEAVEPVATRDTAAPDAKSRGVALLVDDEVLVRMGTAIMLEDLGYQVVEVGSAEEALRLMDGGLQVDVVVTDHLMKGMTGAELAQRINERRSPPTPVLIVSGFTDAKSLPPELARLGKPFVLSDLATSLAALTTGALR